MPWLAHGTALLAALFSVCGCMGQPEEQSELSNGSALARASATGLVEGRLSAVSSLALGPNDFKLALTATASQAPARLNGFEAVMPAHGHRTYPNAIELDTDGYHIVALPLPMAGAWRLSGSVRVDEVVDEIAFDVDVP